MGKFIDFNEFLRDLNSRTYQEQLRLTPDAAVADAAEFEKMRAHLLSLYSGVNVRHSFLAPGGQYIDCVPVTEQPSLRGTGASPATPPNPPLMDRPKAPQAPADRQAGGPASREVTPRLGPGLHDVFGNETCCPKGAIPVRRITLDQLSRYEDLADFFRKGRRTRGKKAVAQFHYGIAMQDADNIGAYATLNTWWPQPGEGQHSISQMWVTGGTGKNFQTLEGGWSVEPVHFHTTIAVPFVYWTADDYQATGGYNLETKGFVQVTRNVILGVDEFPTGVRDGTQYQFDFMYYRDPSTGNWWFYLKGTDGLPHE